MKAVILAGGMGVRISEETIQRPKPLIEIGGRPLLWHIMKIFERHGIRDFIVCLGYKGHMIREYFTDYCRNASDLTVNLATGKYEIHSHRSENWNVTLVDTGLDTLTGGRLQAIKPYLDGQTFMVTYGDGVSDIDITQEIAFHRRHGKAATVAAVQLPGRYGCLELGHADTVSGFEEKPLGEAGWINGGFFVLEPSTLSRLTPDSPMLEREFIPSLAREGQLLAYRHTGFWKSCDTLQDKLYLERICDAKKAPWL